MKRKKRKKKKGRERIVGSQQLTSSSYIISVQVIKCIIQKKQLLSMGRGWTVCELSLNNIVLGPWTQSKRQTLRQMRLHFEKLYLLLFSILICPSKARDSTTLTANHVDHVKTAVYRSTSRVSAECEIVGYRGVQLADWNSSLATIFKKRASESSIDYRWGRSCSLWHHWIYDRNLSTSGSTGKDETGINYYKVCSEFNNAVQSCTY